jgi:dihydrolipoamide dehydrogenase
MKITIIGAGPGGYETAVYAVRQGLEVTLVTEGPLGGTCLNEGCIPTKTFCHYAGHAAYETALQKKQQVVEQLRKGVHFLLKGVHVIEGHATLKDAHTVCVNGTTEIASDYIILATGSVPAKLNIPGIEGKNVLYSQDILSMEELPESICVVGGGVIGLEMASYLHAFGVDVTVVEYADEVLPSLDKELAKRIRMILKKRGVEIVTSAQVTGMDEDGVTYIYKGEEEYAEADAVLMAVGRKAHTADLGLEALGIPCNRKGVEVDDNMKTSVDSVYAIGDVNGRMMLAHVATFQGKRAVNAILGKKDKIQFNLVPSVVYTTPEVASVGRTEEQCEDEELDYRVLKTPFSSNGKAVTMGETEGFCKVLVDNETGQMLGCHILGPHASDLIAEATALMNMHATVEDMQSIIHPHPSLCEIFQETIHK